MKPATRGHDDFISQGALRAAIALVVATIVMAGAARLTGVGRVPAMAVQGVETRALNFETSLDGTLRIRAVGSSDVIQTVSAQGDGGFIRTALQSLSRDRMLTGKTDSPRTLHLMRNSEGRIWLEDPATGRRLTLDAFGSGNTQVFAKLFLKLKEAP